MQNVAKCMSKCWKVGLRRVKQNRQWMVELGRQRQSLPPPPPQPQTTHVTCKLQKLGMKEQAEEGRKEARQPGCTAGRCLSVSVTKSPGQMSPGSPTHTMAQQMHRHRPAACSWMPECHGSVCLCHRHVSNMEGGTQKKVEICVGSCLLRYRETIWGRRQRSWVRTVPHVNGSWETNQNEPVQQNKPQKCKNKNKIWRYAAHVVRNWERQADAMKSCSRTNKTHKHKTKMYRRGSRRAFITNHMPKSTYPKTKIEKANIHWGSSRRAHRGRQNLGATREYRYYEWLENKKEWRNQTVCPKQTNHTC